MELFRAGFMQLAVKLMVDAASLFVVVRMIYYPRMKDKDYLFTFSVFNLLIFLVCYFMNSQELTMGLGFGLFALFGILRYRTILVPIKEMTYLFTVIVLAIINALGSKDFPIAEVIIANLAIVSLVFLLENVWLRTQQGFKIITYEKIDLIKPECRIALLNDLKQRTGLEINGIEIDSINFMNDTCVIKMYHDITNGDMVRKYAEKPEIANAAKIELNLMR